MLYKFFYSKPHRKLAISVSVFFQMLLQLARGIFAEQTSLDSVVQKIMTEAIELMKCKRCLVFILEEHEAVSVRPVQF